MQRCCEFPAADCRQTAFEDAEAAGYRGSLRGRDFERFRTGFERDQRVCVGGEKSSLYGGSEDEGDGWSGLYV